MSTEKKYWQSVEQLREDPEFVEQAQNEFSEQIPVDEFLGDEKLGEANTSRRDFLKFMGFSIGAATLAACETPVTKSIPYVVKPEDIHPGVNHWYASTYSDGVDYCSILVKTREGRPIMIEGNSMSSVTNGAINARVNSSILSLYDSKRLRTPHKNGQPSSWEEVDSEISSQLKSIASSGKQIAILSNSILSPSTKMLVKDVAKALQGTNSEAEGGDEAVSETPSAVRHVTYDAVSYAGIIQANKENFGKAVIPQYHFENAKTIVSVGADFLGTWLSPIEYSRQYAANRKPDGEWMSKHYQFESILSLSGSNADVRGAIKPSEQNAALLHLYNLISKKAGGSTVSAAEIADDNGIMEKLASAAEDLWRNKGNSLLVAASNDKFAQITVNSINYMLGNYGKTIDVDSPSYVRQGNDDEVKELMADLKSGKVGAVLVYGCDPAYSMPASWNFADSFGKAKLKVSFASHLDNTAKLCDYVCPDHNYLESWNDYNPRMGDYSLAQPAITPIFNTRQAQDSLMKWAGMEGNFHQYIQDIWKKYGFNGSGSFTAWWNQCVHDGVSTETSKPKQQSDSTQVAVAPAPAEVEAEESNGFNADMKEAASALSSTAGGNWELSLYMKTAIGEGNHAGNPWLQEMPDPITRVVWDNYITMNPADMEQLGFNVKLGQELPASLAKLSANGISIELPVVAVPGQKKNTVGVALGYGKAHVGNELIGKNAYPMVSEQNGTLCYDVYDVAIQKVEGTYQIASSQTHHTMMGRKIVNETDISTYKNIDKNDKHHGWNPDVLVPDAYNEKQPPKKLSLWQDHNVESFGHRWGMAIDLNACIGCGSCVTACNAENNVPVVGKDEVRRNREMHWIRIDRYFSSDADPVSTGHSNEDKDYAAMEEPSTYPEVVFQPVMCQHCNHAPCETVCPVAATTHSNEGLNQMAYNRCVGTRYCANNCPYKVRRFNWFNYAGYKKFQDFNPAQDEFGRMVLNPDVVVRSRGVMEKCSMCVQRIQAGKLEAKKAGQKVEDGAIQTACSSACPTHAITFGDLNDENTKAHKEMNDDRAYFLLEEIGVQPNISYLTKVRNTEKKHKAVHKAEPAKEKTEEPA